MYCHFMSLSNCLFACIVGVCLVIIYVLVPLFVRLNDAIIHADYVLI